MNDVAVDKITHDLFLNDNDLQIASGADQLEQNLKIRLMFFKNEWFLDTDSGVPYYENILVKNPNIGNIESIYKAIIMDTPGVQEILEFKSEFDNTTREYSISFKVRTDYGESELSVSIF